MLQAAFDYTLFGTHVRFGEGCSLALAQTLQDLGCTRPVLLAQPRMSRSPHYARLRAQLSAMAVLELQDIPMHGSLDLVQSMVPDIRAHGADSLVAIGGGSVSDTVKALAMLLAEGGRLAEHATRFTPPATLDIPRRTRPKLPIIALPTTASGAEITPSFGARDQDRKLLFWNRALACTSALIDPGLSADMPLGMLQQTAMNGMAHCFEGLYSRRRSPVASGVALQALSLFAQALRDPGLDEAAQRSQLLLAGHLSGIVLSMTGSCLHHAICHVIGARHGVAHGAVNTVILAHALRFNESAAADVLAPALAVLNTQAGGTAFARTSDWVSATIDALALPGTLSDLGLAATDLPAIAALTEHERGLALNPRTARVDDILAILQQAL